MLSFGLPGHPDQPLRVLALGCHSDDIEIGAGGLLLRLLQERPRLDVHWVVFSAHDERRGEARASADDLLGGLERLSVDLHGFRDGYFPYDPSLKDVFEALKASEDPDLILTHFRDDLHQDHRHVCELTWNTWRDHLVLEYEIPKYDGDLGRPNVFVPIDESQARRKAEVLMEHFASQRDKHWFTPDLFLGLMRIRGMESRSPTGYAEAFHGRKAVL